MATVSREKEVETELQKVELVIKDITTFQNLSPGGLLGMMFLRYMLKRKGVAYPVGWFRWLREAAYTITAAEWHGINKDIKENAPHKKPIIVSKITIPERPWTKDGAIISLKISRVPPEAYFELQTCKSENVLVKFRVADLFREEIELPSELDWMDYACGGLDNLLWMCVHVCFFSFAVEKMLIHDYHRTVFEGGEILTRIKHEMWLDGVCS